MSVHVIARSASDEAIQLDCFASLAMTEELQ